MKKTVSVLTALGMMISYSALPCGVMCDNAPLTAAAQGLDEAHADTPTVNSACRYSYDEAHYFSKATTLEHTFAYDDSWLFESSASMSGELAKVCVGLSSAAYKQSAALTCLDDMGFKDIEVINETTEPTYADNDHVKVYVGHKRLDGYDVYVVPVRGTTTNCEWFSNFNLGTGDEHTGFSKTALEVEQALLDKLTADSADPDKTIILLTGHSRGGAVANIIAAHLDNGLLGGEGFAVPRSQVFAYTYGCPNVSKNADESLDNIFNFNNPGDYVPTLPLDEPAEDWGFKRNGKTIYLSTDKDVYVAFQQSIYNKTGSQYLGELDTKDFVSGMTEIAPTQAAYNTPENKALFELVAWLMMNKDYQKKYMNYVISNNSAGLSSGVAREIFMYYLGGPFPEDIKLFNVIIDRSGDSINVKKALAHGHTCTTYIEWVNAMFSDTPVEHTHNYYLTEVTRPADCSSDGVLTRSCYCGEALTESIPKLTEHSFGEWAETKAATCTADGTKSRKCTVCGTEETELIQKTGHNYSTKVIKPTYTAAGYTLHTCTVCGSSYKDSPTAKLKRTSIAKAAVSGLSNKTYTGKAITQAPTVKLGGKTLNAASDYTVTYKNNKAVGTATVTVTGKGAYTGTVSKTFKICPKKTTLKSVTSPKTKQLRAAYSKVSGVTGYQIAYSTSGKFTKAATKTAGSKATSKTIGKLTKGKTYYVRVRSYKTVGGTKYYSGWSAVKKVKVK